MAADVVCGSPSGEQAQNKERALKPEPEPAYSTFTEFEKKLYAWIASVGAFASPVSAAIYYPALTDIANDLHTSIGNINLTITTYMILQAIAPTFVGGFSDRYGRRPAFVVCFTIYICANIGLALQSSYAALLVLRCLQSAGSSGTISLSNGVVSDLATRSERGKYIGLASLGSTLGPALGPVIGGLLDHFLGWRSIFWFLVIYAGIMVLVMLLFFPETCRNIVGNGSVPPQRWNISLLTYLHLRRKRKQGQETNTNTITTKHRASILSSIYIVCTKQGFCILFFTGLVYAGFYIVIAGLSTQLASIYNYNSIQVGLCYLPMGFGAIIARQLSGRLIDMNFRRYAKNHNITIIKGQQTNITRFPVEHARLQVGFPFVYAGTALMIVYGWILNLNNPPLPAVLVLLFLLALCLSGAAQVSATLMVDCFPDSPSAASAAGNLLRCGLGAGGIAVLQPLQDTIGYGWTGTLIAGIWLVFSVFWWIVWYKGQVWRAERLRKVEIAKDRDKQTSEV